MKRLRIIPDHLPHYEHNHMIEPKADSSSLLQSDVLPIKSLQLFVLTSKEEHQRIP